jgi:hypothetical protein
MKITKTQLKKMIQEELGGMERGDLARHSMKPDVPYAQNVLAAAMKAISQHQTQMGEPSNHLTYALEQLTELMRHLRGSVEDTEGQREYDKRWPQGEELEL